MSSVSDFVLHVPSHRFATEHIFITPHTRLLISPITSSFLAISYSSKITCTNVLIKFLPAWFSSQSSTSTFSNIT